MNGSKSESDSKFKKKSKHKKYKSKKHKYKSRRRYDSSERKNFSDSINVCRSSSEEKDIKRLKRLKKLDVKDSIKFNSILPVSLFTSNVFFLNENSVKNSKAATIDIPYGPSLELLLTGTETVKGNAEFKKQSIISSDKRNKSSTRLASPISPSKELEDKQLVDDLNEEMKHIAKESILNELEMSTERDKLLDTSNEFMCTSGFKVNNIDSVVRPEIDDKKEKNSKEKSRSRSRSKLSPWKLSRSESYSPQSSSKKSSISSSSSYYKSRKERSYTRAYEKSQQSNCKRSRSRSRSKKSRSFSQSSRRHRRSRSWSCSKNYPKSKHNSRQRSRFNSRDKSCSHSKERILRRSKKESRYSKRSNEKRKSSSERDSKLKKTSQSDSKEKYSSCKIDQAKIREIAEKNVLNMIQQGTLPEGISIEHFKKKELVSIKAGGKSVQELTEFCAKLSKIENDAKSNLEGETDFIHHPFKLREQSMIKLNIKNAVQIPIKTHAEKFAESAKLSCQFPVSSGNQHKQKELERMPEENKKDLQPTDIEPAAPKTIEHSTSVEVAQLVSCDIPLPALPAPQSNVLSQTSTLPADGISSFNNQAAPTSHFDFSSVFSKKFQAEQKLQENPFDAEALKAIKDAEAAVQDWVNSCKVPGMFYGSTQVKPLPRERLGGTKDYRVKRDTFTCAAPVTEGKGMSLLKKMGWNPGEGLGKNKEGSLLPLILDIKMDKKGLVSEGESGKNNLTNAVKELQGKHPVSALMELCSKRKWKSPLYTVTKDAGPPHKKQFLFKVEVNGIDYQPVLPSSNKKVAKADAAIVCLQALKVFPA